MAPGSVLFVLTCSGSAFARLDTAANVGSVVDGSGAVLPGVTMTAIQERTNVALTAVTNASGQDVFPGLRAGRCIVTAERQGSVAA